MRPTLIALSILVLLATTNRHDALADDAASGFQPQVNPSRAWGYGWAPAPGSTFHAFADHGPDSHARSHWNDPNGADLSFGCAGYDSNAVHVGGSFLNARTGGAGETTVLRWTAPSDGTYHANVAWHALGRGPVTLPLSTQIYGGSASGQLGAAIAAADVNSDGYSDVIVGQPNYTSGASQRGRVQLFRGGPSGLSSTAAWSYMGPGANAILGTSVACGDVNGDGHPDLIVGVPGFLGPGGAGQGEVLVFLGNGNSFASTPAWSALGAAAGAHFGFSVAIGDVNGGGYGDVLVGAPDETHGQTGEGRAYLWLGSASGLGGNGTSTNATWTAEIDQAGAQFGLSVAVIGDMNGDGKSEVVIGAPNWDNGTYTNAGWVGMYYGSTNGIETLAAFAATVSQAQAQLGLSVAAAGDLDGDGLPDFIAGAPGAGTGGQALVWRGGSLGPVTPPIVLSGTLASGSFGYSVAAAGHVQHGGHAGVIVGAERYSNGDSQEGAAFYFPGNSGGVATTPTWSLESNQPFASMGFAVAGAGDVNGDANDDLAIGAPGYTQTLSSEGRLTVAYDAGGTPTPYTRALVGVYRGSTALAGTVLDQAAGHDTTFAALDVALLSGQSIDIVVGGAGGDPAFADVSIDADVLDASPPEGTSGPVYALANQRYEATKGGPGFDAIAWDPTRGHYASGGSVYDSCGTQLSTGPDGQAIAWDPVSLTYWSVAHDAGNARWAFLRYSGANGAFVDTALTIPDRFTVPGFGPDTLEDVRGVALDSTSIYVVDAGALNLVPPRNEWFKFTRAGAPSAVRSGASFSVNATGDIVDEIVYAPFASPTEPGRLLVAIEHTGIDVIDRNGTLVETFRWSAQGLSAGEHPSAFAGLGLDAVSGDLFLVDNDRAAIERWERIPSASATSYLVGTGSNVAYLHTPSRTCSAPLWTGSWGTPCAGLTLVFGIAYRDVDQRVYGVDYITGDLWRFDPRSGAGERVASTNVANIWGLAYDAQRDLLVGDQQGANQIWTIRPVTAAATALPLPGTYNVSDLAIDPDTHAVYGVDRSSNPPHLVRFDRDTGAGTLVGNTHGVVGLDYDAGIGNLVATDCCSDTLWQIATSNGAASFLRLRPAGEGWEGLAVIPVGAAPVLAVDEHGARNVPLAFAAGPNPWRSRVAFRFALAAAQPVDLDVFDVAGRRVRRLVSGALTAGEHVAEWDGMDARGQEASAGVYFARLRIEGARVVRTIVRVR